MINTLQAGKWLDSTVFGEMCLAPPHKSQDNSQHRHQRYAVSATAFTLRCPYFAQEGWWFLNVNVSSQLTSQGCEAFVVGCGSRQAWVLIELPSPVKTSSTWLQTEAWKSNLKCARDMRKGTDLCLKCWEEILALSLASLHSLEKLECFEPPWFLHEEGCWLLD